MPKQVVRVDADKKSQASQPTGQPSQPKPTLPPGQLVDQGGQTTWAPAAASKQQATTFRIIALVLWELAIAGELFAIFYVLKQNPINMVLLIGAIVVIGVLAVIGDLLWKRANQLDPASTAEPVKFFIQNQLGAIIGLIAFLPLIVMVLMNKNMNQQQKGVASAVGIVVLAIATIMGVSFNPPSTQQYTQTAVVQATAGAPSGLLATPAFPAESAVVIGYTGRDQVFWTKDGTVYHLCQAVSDLQQESKDNTIYSGTVADAHTAGKNRLTLKVDTELKQCGLGTAVPAGTITPAK